MATGIRTAEDAATSAAAAVRSLEPRFGGHRGPALLRLDIPRVSPLTLWDAFPASDATAWQARSGPLVASIGAARRVPAGPGVPAVTSQAALSGLAGELLRVDVSAGAPFEEDVRLYGGTAFNEVSDDPAWQAFGSGEFVLPKVTLAAHGDGSRLQLAVELTGARSDLDQIAPEVEDLVGRLVARDRSRRPPAPEPRATVETDRQEAIPDQIGWGRMVEYARDAIRAGRIDKVVLARRRSLCFDAPLDPLDVLTRLASRGNEYVFGIRRSGSCFLGATPELLLAKQGRDLRTEALAGTRRLPTSPDRNSALIQVAEELFASGKDLEEHALVVQGIVEALEPVAEDRELAPWPELRALTDLAHLCSRIEFRLQPGVGPFELLDALHPTPAVGGLPRAAALSLIAQVEPAGRGWFAAPIGWVTLGGDAELAVGIRSALLDGHLAHLFAGAGIVLGSEPEGEFGETEDKLGRLMDALGVAGRTG